MTKTIYKYELKTETKQFIELNKDDVCLSVQIQNNKIQLWASVNPEKEKEKRTIFIFGIGEEIDESLYLSFISTFQHNGNVFHVFEEIIN